MKSFLGIFEVGKEIQYIIVFCFLLSILHCLSQDFHILGGSIVSCGMDHSLKLWQLDSSEIKDAIEASERPPIKKLAYTVTIEIFLKSALW